MQQNLFYFVYLYNIETYCIVKTCSKICFISHIMTWLWFWVLGGGFFFDQWMKMWIVRQKIHSSIPLIGTCRMRRFLAILRIFFHFSLLCTFSCHTSPPTILPSSLISSCHFFLVYLSILLFPNSYIILFWEFYFLPFSLHAQTNVIYLIFTFAPCMLLHLFYSNQLMHSF